MPVEAMKTGIFAVLLVVFGAITGAVVGRVVWPPDPSPIPATASGDRDVARPSDTARGMVCVREVAGYPRGRDDDDEGCAREGLELAVCEAHLDECTRAKASLRHGWPEEAAPNEDPSAFLDTIETSLAACGMGDALEMVDCSEYPCVAALRPAPSGAALDEAALEKLNADIEGCAPLREAFEVGDGQGDALEVYPVRVPCGGEEQVAYVMSALHTQGDAWSALKQGQNDDYTEVLRWMFRRGDDVAALWNCEPESE